MPIYRVIGSMTGTSCDGLDLAYLETNGADILHFGPSITIPFDTTLQKILRKRVQVKLAFDLDDENLGQQIAAFHGKNLKNFILANQLQVDAVGFHGQSVWHDPKNAVTVQLGDCQYLANLLSTKVIGQFRQADIKNGGQGAPLVPIYHQALATGLKKPLGFLNIGGVSNITYINDSALVAGDTGPGNALIDDWVETQTGVAQDTGGKYAAAGKINYPLLERWLNDPFFEKPFPKSLDRMHFHNVLEDCQGMNLEDGAATLTQFTVESICLALTKLPKKLEQLVVCGGGCHNQTLMAGLCQKIKNVTIASDLGMDPDAIEAQLMAYLAARFFEELPSSFASTTGVEEPTIAGKLFIPERD